MYETPSVTELGSVANFTRASGSGPDQDSQFPFSIFDPNGAPRPTPTPST
jgi:hypothetical protein